VIEVNHNLAADLAKKVFCFLLDNRFSSLSLLLLSAWSPSLCLWFPFTSSANLRPLSLFNGQLADW